MDSDLSNFLNALRVIVATFTSFFLFSSCFNIGEVLFKHNDSRIVLTTFPSIVNRKSS